MAVQGDSTDARSLGDLGSAPGAPPGFLATVFDSFRVGMSAALVVGIVVVALGTIAAWVSGRGQGRGASKGVVVSPEGNVA